VCGERHPCVNRIHGRLPASLGSLSALQVLCLRDNALTGRCVGASVLALLQRVVYSVQCMTAGWERSGPHGLFTAGSIAGCVSTGVSGPCRALQVFVSIRCEQLLADAATLELCTCIALLCTWLAPANCISTT
jgi:hypothetical protein